jgi:tetratricopeptide (TPR) repeat protein
MGGVVPQAGPDGRLEFTFQQLVLLRTTRGLLEAGIPPSRVRRVWTSLRRQLTDDLPLTSIRILADGDRAVAWDGSAPWQPDSGQFLLDFNAGELVEEANSPLPVEPAAELPETPATSAAPRFETPALSSEQWFHLGCEMEGTSPHEARHAYLQAIAADPDCADAHLNLGRLDHEAGELGAAEARYRRALQCTPEDATAHYNLAVLLEDRDRPEEAILAYRQAIAHDPEAADAHYNLGLLLESHGRRSEAMRHLMAARRLYAL